MKTYLIQNDVSNGSDINLTARTPGSWVNGAARFVTLGHGDVRDESQQSRIDLSIVSIASGPNLSIGNTLLKTEFNNTLFVSRNLKPDQAFFLQDFINKHKNTGAIVHMVQPMTWRDYKTYSGDMSEYVLLRPMAGARSIGLVLLDPTKTSISSVHDKLALFLSKTEERNKQNSSEEKITEANESIYSALNELPGNPIWCSEGDRYAYEGANIFLERFFVQNYIPNVKNEYRIVIGGDNIPVYAIERKRTHFDNLKGVAMAYARGHNCGIENSHVNFEGAGLPDFVWREFQLLLDKYDFSLFSFDIFVTEDDQWGIFEFSPEFGTSSVPNDLCFREAKIFIERVIKKASRTKPCSNLL